MKKSLVAMLAFFFLLCSAVADGHVNFIRKEEKVKKEIGILSITMYCTGYKTASDVRPYEGCIAFSRDIIKKHKLKFGEKFYIEDIGHVTYADKMPPQWSKRVDVYTKSKKRAVKWGKQKKKVYKVKKRIYYVISRLHETSNK